MMSKENDARKDEFINAAEKLFKKNGIVHTTVNSIVKEMDVAKGLFYYYFNSKDDVIDAISEKYNRDFKQGIKRAFSAEHGDYEERLKDFIDDTVNSFRNMWNNLHGEQEDTDLMRLSVKSIEQAKQTATQALLQLLEEGNRMGKTAVKDASYLAEMIVSGIADLAQNDENDLDEIKQMMIDLIHRFGKEN